MFSVKHRRDVTRWRRTSNVNHDATAWPAVRGGTRIFSSIGAASFLLCQFLNSSLATKEVLLVTTVNWRDRCKLRIKTRQHSASVARVWRYRNLIITLLYYKSRLKIWKLKQPKYLAPIRIFDRPRDISLLSPIQFRCAQDIMRSAASQYGRKVEVSWLSRSLDILLIGKRNYIRYIQSRRKTLPTTHSP